MFCNMKTIFKPAYLKSSRLLSSFNTDMTQNLKVKVIVIDPLVVISEEPERASKPSPSKADLLAKIELKELDEKSPLKFDIKAKYEDKIKMKLALKSVERKADPLASARLGTGSRWLLAEGMGDVLDYVYNRTVRLALVGGVKYRQNTFEALQSQCNQTKFAFIRNDIESPIVDKNTNSKEILQEIQESLLEMENKLGYNKTQVLLVSSEESMLSLGRDRGYYTCRYR